MAFEPFDATREALKLAPGVLGAISSLLWVKGGWARLLGMFVAGSALSRYGAATVSKWTTLDEGFAGYLLGMLGMMVVAKVVDIWTTFDLTGLLREWLRKKLGLPPEGGP